MEYVKLGNTGMDISRLCLGCMSFGVPERGIAPWSLSEELSRPIIKRAVELGINFFDTANIYSDGLKNMAFLEHKLLLRGFCTKQL